MMLLRKVIFPKAEVLPLLALLLSLACAMREDHYQVDDDDDDDDEGGEGRGAAAAPVDYTRYFGAGSSPSAASPDGGPAPSESGFVQPIDFARLLANAELGEAGQAVAAGSSRVQDFFRAADAANAAIFALPTSTGVFASDPTGSETQNNGTGFTSSQVRFPSLFDASAHSDEGFRPQDFLQVGNGENKEASQQDPVNVFSPSFSKLDSDYRPQSQASYTKPSYSGSEGDPRVTPAGPSRRQYLPLQSGPPSSAPAAPSSSPRLSPPSPPALQYQAHAAAPAHQSSSPGVPIDIYGSKVSSYPRPAPSEPHVGKSSYPGSQPVDYTSKPKAVHDAPAKINPEYFSLPSSPSSGGYLPASQPSSYLPAAQPSGGYLPASQPSSYLPASQPSTYKPASQPSTYASASQPSPYNPGPNPYLPAAPAPAQPKADYNIQPAGEIYSPTNQQVQKDAAPKDKKCTKIDKTISTDDLVKGRFRRDAAMTCYVCEDPKTGGNFEECSYATEPKAAKYFIGHAQSFSTDKVLKPQTYRYRRDVDPFRYSRNYDHELYTSADSSYKYPYAHLRDDKNYHFKEEDFAPTHVDYTAAPSDKNCQKVQKDSMTCYVCKDPKTGGSYEQCSYATQPKANNYFVARESSFNSAKPYQERYRRDDKYGRGDGSSGPSLGSSDASGSSSDREEHRGGIGLDPFLYGEPKFYDPKEDKKTASSEAIDRFYAPYRSYEEYFSHLFPELVPREASASSPEGVTNDEKQDTGFQYKTSIPDYFTDTEKKKDLDSVLGEFTSKDRSNCKKVQKDKMTCYQCIDQQGMQHEECMFVAASEPKSQHLAYKEVKEFNLVPQTAAGSSKVAVTAEIPGADVTPASTSDVVSAAAAALAAAAATLKENIPEVPTVTPVTLESLKAKRDALIDEMVAAATDPHYQKRRQAEEEEDAPRNPRRKAPVEPTPPELSELDRSPDGLYSAETKHRFDPVLKVTLPEYMLTRSEHEAIFDEVMASGR